VDGLKEHGLLERLVSHTGRTDIREESPGMIQNIIVFILAEIKITLRALTMIFSLTGSTFLVKLPDPAQAAGHLLEIP